jgi:hypothetical protein
MPNADTVYAPKPWASNEERLVTESLNANSAPADLLRQMPPAPPRRELFPPRFGYRVDAIGIDDVVKIDEVFPGARVDFSQMTSGYSGSSYPVLGVM